MGKLVHDAFSWQRSMQCLLCILLWGYSDVTMLYFRHCWGNHIQTGTQLLLQPPLWQKNLAELMRWLDQPFHSWEWSMSNFPSSPTRNITSHSKENLAFHSLLRWKMILIQILTTLCIFSLEGWENVLFELRTERVYPFTPKFKKYILRHWE